MAVWADTPGLLGYSWDSGDLGLRTGCKDIVTRLS